VDRRVGGWDGLGGLEGTPAVLCSHGIFLLKGDLEGPLRVPK
jgi:hypothetical protein